MKKDDCIFCKLSNGDIPTNALYEDDVVKVIFDLNPASKGHVLILPKNHSPIFLKYRKIWMPRHLFLPKRLQKNERCFWM